MQVTKHGRELLRLAAHHHSRNSILKVFFVVFLNSPTFFSDMFFSVLGTGRTCLCKERNKNREKMIK